MVQAPLWRRVILITFLATSVPFNVFGQTKLSSSMATELGAEVFKFLRAQGNRFLRNQDPTHLQKIVKKREAVENITDIRHLIPVTQGRQIEEARLKAQEIDDSFQSELLTKLGNYFYDLASLVIDAHCSAFKEELKTGKPITYDEYVGFVVWEILKSQEPSPTTKELRERVELASRFYNTYRTYHASRGNDTDDRAVMIALCPKKS